MNKIREMLKSLDKNGFKLALLCGLNWWIKLIAKSQFYIISAVCLGFLTHYVPLKDKYVVIYVFQFLFVIRFIYDFLLMFSRLEFRRIWSILSLVFLTFVFLKSANFTLTHSMNGITIQRLLAFCFFSYLIVAVGKFTPTLFDRYLFKNVLNKKYLGIRKLSDPFPPEVNFYTDANELDAEKRMTTINQNAIKEPYQNVVQLGYLSKQRITGVVLCHPAYLGDEKPLEKHFEDLDTTYLLNFSVYPFGKEHDFYVTLTYFTLSRRHAFTMKGKRVLSSTS